MQLSNKGRRFIAIGLLLTIVLAFSGCSKVPFFNSDNKTKEEYQTEATEVAYIALQRMLAGDYENVKTYVDSENRSKVSDVLAGVDPRLANDATIVIESVFTEEKTYDTQVQFRITIAFAKRTTSIMCVMKLARYNGGWRIYNVIPFCSDLSKLNAMYIDGKSEDEKYEAK